MSENLKIKIIKNIKVEQIIDLYKEAGWWDEDDEKNPIKVRKIIKGSNIFIGAFIENKLVGMARVLSDGISDAYIQDVIVKENYRKKGIGKKLIIFLLNYLKKKQINWIGLISTPSSKEFYKKLGFETLVGFEPMIFKGSK